MAKMLPAIDDPNEGLPHNLPRLTPLRQDASISVRVLDGRYRVAARGRQSRWEDAVDQLPRRIEVDVEGWPNVIEVRGNVVQLPPVVLRLAEVIELQSPAHGSVVDLSDTQFSWSTVPQAVRYQVQMMHTTEGPSPMTDFFLTVRVPEPRFRLRDLTAAQQELAHSNWIPGRTGGWRVDAYDAADRRVGRSLAENHFLIARGYTPAAKKS